jgi:hypothetical protein
MKLNRSWVILMDLASDSQLSPANRKAASVDPGFLARSRRFSFLLAERWERLWPWSRCQNRDKRSVLLIQPPSLPSGISGTIPNRHRRPARWRTQPEIVENPNGRILLGRVPSDTFKE